METQLLIIKIQADYIRVKDDNYLVCGLDKASVFPMEELDTVKAHVAAMEKKTGMAWHHISVDPQRGKIVIFNDQVFLS